MSVKDIEDRLADSIQQAVTAANHPQEVPVNMYEADEAYVVIAPLPGVMPDDIEVHIDGNDACHHSAEMRTPAIKAYLIHEWHYGPYERVVDMPDDCTGEFETSFGNGQLAVRAVQEYRCRRSTSFAARRPVCRNCDLWKCGTQTVFGEGRDDARLMLVGEQPGDHEDVEGRPFVGPAGRTPRPRPRRGRHRPRARCT